MPIEEYFHDDGSQTVETYSENGLLIQLEDLEEDGSLSTRIVYRYDKRGNNVESLITDGVGNQRWRLEFTFDDSDRKLWQKEYGPGNDLVYRHEYSYGEPNGKIRAKIYDKNGGLLKESVEDFI